MKKILSLVLAAGIMTSASAMTDSTEKSFAAKAKDVATNPYIYVPTAVVLSAAVAATLDVCYNQAAVCNAIWDFIKNIPGYSFRGTKTGYEAIVDFANEYPVAFISAVSVLTIGGGATAEYVFNGKMGKVEVPAIEEVKDTGNKVTTEAKALVPAVKPSYTGKGYKAVKGLFEKKN